MVAISSFGEDLSSEGVGVEVCVFIHENSSGLKAGGRLGDSLG